MHLKHVLFAIVSAIALTLPLPGHAYAISGTRQPSVGPVRAESRLILDDAGIIPDADEKRIRAALSERFPRERVAVVILTDALPADRIDTDLLQKRIISLVEPIPCDQAVIILMTGEPNISLIMIGEVGDRIAVRAKTSWQPFEQALRSLKERRPAEAIDIILKRVIPDPST